MDREASGTTVHKDRPHSMHAHPSPIAAGGERLFQFLGNLTLETKFKSSIYQLKGFFFSFSLCKSAYRFTGGDFSS